jgi:1,4-dihydroxy-2-naphthoate polyprenyltransferase
VSDTPGPLRRWVLAARPRTLPAAAVPVALGALSVRPATVVPVRTILALVVALALQIGTNYANDYADGVRGTDEKRVGPFRLTASRLVSAPSVRNAAFAWFGVAAVAGLVLALSTTWWLVAIGASAVAAGWFYTGGPKPYGYYGWGEFFVFVYFGLVATVGTAYVQHQQITARAWWLGVSAGAMACVLLEANNLRDVDGDRASGKKTLAARLGRRRAIALPVFAVVAVCAGFVGARLGVMALVALAVYVPALRRAFSPATGRELLPMLRDSARAQLALGVLTVVALALRP